MRTYSVKAEDLFCLIPYKGMDKFTSKPTTQSLSLLTSLEKSLKIEREDIMEANDVLMNSNLRDWHDLEYITIQKLWSKTFDSYTSCLWNNEFDKCEELKKISNKSSEVFVSRKRLAFLYHLISKDFQALLGDLKKVAKVQPRIPKRIVVNKPSDLSTFLKQFELNKNFEAMERTALKVQIKGTQLIGEPLYNILMKVLTTYEMQHQKLVGINDEVKEIIKNLKFVDSRQQKVIDNWVKFKSVCVKLIVKNQENDALVWGEPTSLSEVTNETFVKVAQKNIKLYKSMRAKLIYFYRAFSEFDNN